MGLLTFGLNVTLDGCCDHREGIADDELHDYFTQLMDAAGAMLAVVGYTSLYYLLMLALLSPLVVLLWARGRAAYGRAALTALTAVIFLMPLLGPAVQTARNAEVIAASPEEAQARSTNLLDVVLPSYLHPLWGDAVFERVSATWHNYSGDWNAALGYGVLALALNVTST